MKNLTALKKQHGSILIISLLMLVVLTIIGVSSMSSSSLQEKMSGNFRDREIAFQAAEIALRTAEHFVEQNISTANLPNTNGLYTNGNGPTSKDSFTNSWWAGASSKAVSTNLKGIRSAPRYTIEYRYPIAVPAGTSINIGGYGVSTGSATLHNFRVTVRATGLSDNTRVVLQSNYAKEL